MWPSSTPGCKRSLVGLDVALLDDRPPARVLVTEELAEFGWRARLGIDALRVDAVANLRIVDGLLHLERQAIERGALQVGRREEAVPRAALVVRQSLLGDGRKIGRTAMALHRADAQRSTALGRWAKRLLALALSRTNPTRPALRVLSASCFVVRTGRPGGYQASYAPGSAPSIRSGPGRTSRR